MTAFAVRMVFRSLRRRARRSAVTFTGVALAVAALVVLAALMEGVSEAMIRNSVAVEVGHVHATWADGGPARPIPLTGADVPALRTALWRKRRAAILAVGGRSRPAAVVGVDPAAERAESVVPRKLIRGRYLAGPGCIVLGVRLAEALGVDVGGTVRLGGGGLVRLEGGGLAGRQFRVGGIFRTGLEPVDSSACVALDDLPGACNELAVYLRSSAAAERARRALAGRLAGAEVRTWRQLLPELVQLLGLNRVSMNVVFALAVLILAFGISNTAYMSVSERTRELGILQAMGMRPGQIVALILAEVGLLVLAAAVAGVGVGGAAAGVLGRVGLDLGAWTSENRHFLLSGVVYPRLTAYAVVAPGVVAAVCGLLAGVGPAWRGARMDVVRALRWI